MDQNSKSRLLIDVSSFKILPTVDERLPVLQKEASKEICLEEVPLSSHPTFALPEFPSSVSVGPNVPKKVNEILRLYNLQLDFNEEDSRKQTDMKYDRIDFINLHVNKTKEPVPQINFHVKPEFEYPSLISTDLNLVPDELLQFDDPYDFDSAVKKEYDYLRNEHLSMYKHLGPKGKKIFPNFGMEQMKKRNKRWRKFRLMPVYFTQHWQQYVNPLHPASIAFRKKVHRELQNALQHYYSCPTVKGVSKYKTKINPKVAKIYQKETKEIPEIELQLSEEKIDIYSMTSRRSWDDVSDSWHDIALKTRDLEGLKEDLITHNIVPNTGKGYQFLKKFRKKVMLSHHFTNIENIDDVICKTEFINDFIRKKYKKIEAPTIEEFLNALKSTENEENKLRMRIFEFIKKASNDIRSSIRNSIFGSIISYGTTSLSPQKNDDESGRHPRKYLMDLYNGTDKKQPEEEKTKELLEEIVVQPEEKPNRVSWKKLVVNDLRQSGIFPLLRYPAFRSTFDIQLSKPYKRTYREQLKRDLENCMPKYYLNNLKFSRTKLKLMTKNINLLDESTYKYRGRRFKAEQPKGYKPSVEPFLDSSYFEKKKVVPDCNILRQLIENALQLKHISLPKASLSKEAINLLKHFLDPENFPQKKCHSNLKTYSNYLHDFVKLDQDRSETEAKLREIQLFLMKTKTIPEGKPQKPTYDWNTDAKRACIRYKRSLKYRFINHMYRMYKRHFRRTMYSHLNRKPYYQMTYHERFLKFIPRPKKGFYTYYYGIKNFVGYTKEMQQRVKELFDKFQELPYVKSEIFDEDMSTISYKETANVYKNMKFKMKQRNILDKFKNILFVYLIREGRLLARQSEEDITKTWHQGGNQIESLWTKVLKKMGRLSDDYIFNGDQKLAQRLRPRYRCEIDPIVKEPDTSQEITVLDDEKPRVIKSMLEEAEKEVYSDAESSIIDLAFNHTFSLETRKKESVIKEKTEDDVVNEIVESYDSSDESESPLLKIKKRTLISGSGSTPKQVRRKISVDFEDLIKGIDSYGKDKQPEEIRISSDCMGFVENQEQKKKKKVTSGTMKISAILHPVYHPMKLEEPEPNQSNSEESLKFKYESVRNTVDTDAVHPYEKTNTDVIREDNLQPPFYIESNKTNYDEIISFKNYLNNPENDISSFPKDIPIPMHLFLPEKLIKRFISHTRYYNLNQDRQMFPVKIAPCEKKTLEMIRENRTSMISKLKAMFQRRRDLWRKRSKDVKSYREKSWKKPKQYKAPVPKKYNKRCPCRAYGFGSDIPRAHHGVSTDNHKPGPAHYGDDEHMHKVDYYPKAITATTPLLNYLVRRKYPENMTPPNYTRYINPPDIEWKARKQLERNVYLMGLERERQLRETEIDEKKKTERKIEFYTYTHLGSIEKLLKKRNYGKWHYPYTPEEIRRALYVKEKIKTEPYTISKKRVERKPLRKTRRRLKVEIMNPELLYADKIHYVNGHKNVFKLSHPRWQPGESRDRMNYFDW